MRALIAPLLLCAACGPATLPGHRVEPLPVDDAPPPEEPVDDPVLEEREPAPGKQVVPVENEPDEAACPTFAGPSFACPACANASPGDVVSLAGLDVLVAPEPGFLPAVSGERVLLFSDSPESPSTSGVLTRGDFAAGPARVFAWHENAYAGGDKKMVIVVENPGDTALRIDLERFAVTGPSTSFAAAGKEAVARALTEQAPLVKSVPPRSAGLLLTTLDGLAVPPGRVVHAIVDVTFSQPARVLVVMLDATTNTLDRYDELAVLPRDAHDRGTFPGADRTLALPAGCALSTSSGVSRVRLGADTQTAPRPSGLDELTGAPAVLGGHYGVRYRLTADVEEGSSAMAVLVNPRAGAWGGAVTVDGEVIPLPSATTTFADATKAAVLGVFPAGARIDVEFVPPGGTSLPVDVLFVPVD